MCNPDPWEALYCLCPLDSRIPWEMMKLFKYHLFSLGPWTINSHPAFCVVFSPYNSALVDGCAHSSSNGRSKHSVPGGEFFIKKNMMQPHLAHKVAPRTLRWWIPLNVYPQWSALGHVGVGFVFPFWCQHTTFESEGADKCAWI